MLWIKVGSVECGKLVDWAACVCATIDYPALLPHGQPCLLILHVLSTAVHVRIPTVDHLLTVCV